jgi:hypothetical protein
MATEVIRITCRPQYNGNIATVKTKTADVNGVAYDALTYDYGYDDINRLTDAVSTGTAAKDDYYGEHLRYSSMGDITGLGRYDKVNGARVQIDTLTYTYSNSYRPGQIDDASAYTGLAGFTDRVKNGGEYTYDGNGNQKREEPGDQQHRVQYAGPAADGDAYGREHGGVYL